ncbi:hypothetical protein [Pseudomonas fulva]|uniref:hypothetical protein n=1 Tax=Pseudomonas fulva TaxID=47880 RepID=UPI0018AAAC32|nr:hypothetical protein [Pseudomonas fulva]MBF8773872.1 hypothetical protein [Pseudomonas fulva]
MSREVVMPDHPLHLQARDAHRDDLEAKERGEQAATVEKLRMMYVAQMKAATD